MKKSNVRNYVVAAFRFYARMGEPDLSGIPKLEHLTEAERLDLSAVAAMLEKLRAQGDTSTIAAVREVYFLDAFKKYNRDGISKKVIKYALNNYVSERTVWGNIDKAMKLFVEIRKLRLEKI